MYLTDDYQKERVIFRHKLFGVIAERSRFIQCVEWTNKHFGLAVGSLFIRDYFNPDSRNMATEMIHALKDAFKELLQRNSWMDKDTKSLAIDKANAIRERIGYPDMITNATKLSQEYAGVTVIAFGSNLTVLILHFPIVKNYQRRFHGQFNQRT